MVAMLVLMIALVNFINITSSQWRERIKQFGIKKVLGAKRISYCQGGNGRITHLFSDIPSYCHTAFVSFSLAIGNNTGIIFNERIIGSFGFIILSVSSVFLLSVIISIFPAIRISSSNAIDNLKKTILKEENQVFIKRDISYNTVFSSNCTDLFHNSGPETGELRYKYTGNYQDNILCIKLTPQLNGKKNV